MKWWKKVVFRLLNLSMTNTYSIQLLAKIEKLQGNNTYKVPYITVIKKLLASTVPPQQIQSVPSVTEFAHFTGRHFPELIPCNGKQVVRCCQVCNPAEQQMDKLAGKLPHKHPGRESSYQCDICKISLCIGYASSYTIREKITFKDT